MARAETTDQTTDTVDPATLAYYESNAFSLQLTYEAAGSVNERYFGYAFPPHLAKAGGVGAAYRVLDVGCGTGRDVLRLLEHGYDAHGIDPSAAMLGQAQSQSAVLESRVSVGALGQPGLAKRLGTFDGILCSAVLHHVPTSQLVTACASLCNLLVESGRLFLSVVASTAGDSRVQVDGRLQNITEPESLTLLFERLGFSLVERWAGADALGRSGRSWHNFVFVRSRQEGVSGLKRIESIITEDRKTSTYKLALLRALCEVALSSERAVVIDANGAHVPVILLAERWLAVYWPLLTSPVRAPQSSAAVLAFEKPLIAFAALFPTGTYAEFRERRTRGLAADLHGFYESLIKAIAETLLKNPVQYAGGGGSDCKPFSRSRMPGTSLAAVCVSLDVWREFLIFGPWINDALVVRWAQWSGHLAEARGSDRGAATTEVLSLLLASDQVARDTSLQRALILQCAEDLRGNCTWTGQPLGATAFAIDHVLPFATFRNNDLWNLVPTNAAVNADKSDRIPSPDLFLCGEVRRRMFARWDTSRAAFRERFEVEAGRFTGVRIAFDDDVDNGRLIDALRETAVLAVRGDPRGPWHPWIS